MSKKIDEKPIIIEADASKIAQDYYTEYAKYVLEYRALPSIYDGLKPVQRRILYIANQQASKLMKTAKLAGMIMSLHPHGSASISGAMYEMASPLNVVPLFKTKGNFGGIGLAPAADRYTELYLNEFARYNFCQFIDYADYELGEIGEQEPAALPSLIPYCLFKGSEGIAIGLSTKIIPLDLMDLIDYYIDYIKHDGKSSKFIKPDVGKVILDMKKSEIKSSVLKYTGKLSGHSVVSDYSKNALLVEDLYDKSPEAFVNKVDKKKWISSGKVGFKDLSSDSMKLIFEIYDKSISIEELRKVLTKASSGVKTYTRVLEEDGSAVYSNLNYIVKKSLEYLNKAIDKKLATEILKYKKQLEIYECLDKCKSLDLFKDASKRTTEELIKVIMKKTKYSEEIVSEVVKKPISYLTKSHDEEKKSLEESIKSIETHDRKEYLISLYQKLRSLAKPYYDSKGHTIINTKE